MTASVGIAVTWLGSIPLWWQLPALTVAALLFLEFNDVGASAFEMALSQPAQLGLGAEHRAGLTIRNTSAVDRILRICPVPPDGVFAARHDCHAQLEPGGSKTEEFAVSGTLLGSHTWPAQPVEIRGRFGLASWIRQVPLAAVSRVVPNRRLLHMNPRGLSESGLRPLLKAGTAGEEVRGLREYSPGDPPSAIDWKATARSRELMVRETTDAQHVEIVVAIDAGQASGLACGELNVLGHCVNVAARVLATAQLRGDRVGLLVFADRVLASLPPGLGISHQQRLQNLLAATVTSSAESNPLPAIVALSRLARRRSLLVVFSQLHDAQANGQLLRAIRLLRPKHLPLIVAVRDPAIDALATQAATHWLDPYKSLAALEYQRDVRAVKQRLQRLGADVVEAAPDELGDVVLRRFQQLRKLRRI
jgi:uncharacterized protein (DUF58 family)